MRVESLQRVEGTDEANDIASALASYADAQRPPAPPKPKSFGVGETAIVLAVAAVVTVTLDSEGLMTWAQRLEVGPVQNTLLSVLAPVHAGLTKVGLAVPRHVVAQGRERLSIALGGEGDPLLAEGWTQLPLPAKRGEGRGEGQEVALVDAGIAKIDEPPVIEEPPPSSTPLGQTGMVSEALGEGGGVLVLGDSMIAGVLGATLEQTLARGTGLPVTRAAQLGTGLSRPDVFDWNKVVPPLQRRDRPRFVVVSLGANDATNLREGEATIEYGEAKWKTVYAARVEAMMRMLALDGVQVLWLGLPPMRDTRLQARAAYLNGIFTQVSKKVRGVEVLPVDLLVGDAEGRYATFVTAPDGKLRRYRLDDGVHLAPAGARAVSSWVLDWVKERAR